MDQNQEIIDELKNLNQKIEKFTKPSKFSWFNFIGGIAWGLGVTVGISLIAYLLGLVLRAFEAMPFIGERLADIVEHTLWTTQGSTWHHLRVWPCGRKL